MSDKNDDLNSRIPPRRPFSFYLESHKIKNVANAYNKADSLFKSKEKKKNKRKFL